MAVCSVTIPFKMPSCNAYIEACRRNRFQAAKLKRETEEAIMVYIRHLPRFENSVFINFEWIEDNRKRDLDGISFGKKFILDALVKIGKLPNDSQKYVKGFSDVFRIGDKPGVIITIVEDEE